MKPNYNQQRSERDRLKRARKEEKARDQEDTRARRRAEQAALDAGVLTPAAPAAEPAPVTDEPQN
jgi:hypothetical protein